MRVLAELIASDVSLLVTFNQAIDGVIQNNQKAGQNPKALAQLNGAVPELCVITSRSLLVFIQAFKCGVLSLVLPIRRHKEK